MGNNVSDIVKLEWNRMKKKIYIQPTRKSKIKIPN